MASLALQIYNVRLIGVKKPRVFRRLTVTRPEGIRDIKDQMSRYIIDAFYREKIGIASGTYAIVEIPPIRVVQTPTPPQEAR